MEGLSGVEFVARAPPSQRSLWERVPNPLPAPAFRSASAGSVRGFGLRSYLDAAFSFFLAFFSLTVSLGLLVVFVFSVPLGIVSNSLRKPKWRARSKYSLWPASGRVENQGSVAAMCRPSRASSTGSISETRA